MVTPVYLHGQIENGSVWKKVDDIVRQAGYKGIVIDFPIYSRSIDSHVEHVHKQLSLVKGEKVLIGASKGSMAAIKYAAIEPEDIGGLVLISPRADFSDKEKKRYMNLIELLKPKENGSGRLNFSSEEYQGDLSHKIAYLRKNMSLNHYEQLVEQSKALMYWDVSEYIPEISAPIELIFGENDNSLDPNKISNLHFQNAKSIILPKGTHQPHIDNSSIVSQKIIRFLMTYNSISFPASSTKISASSSVL